MPNQFYRTESELNVIDPPTFFCAKSGNTIVGTWHTVGSRKNHDIEDFVYEPPSSCGSMSGVRPGVHGEHREKTVKDATDPVFSSIKETDPL